MKYPPIIIEVALWYYTRPGDHPQVESALGYERAAEELYRAGLLLKAEGGNTLYAANMLPLTMYVEALGNVPFPVKKWAMPDET